MLPNFFVKKTTTPRNYTSTFHENGFYKTLKRRVRNVLSTIPQSNKQQSIIVTDWLLIGYISTAILSAILRSYTIGAISGILLGLLTIAAHNFFHKKDNFRMFYFDFSLMSSR